MGTTVYFDENVRDEVTKRATPIEIGTTGFAGNGPQLFIKIGDEELILSHADAAKLCEATADVARYFGYPD